MFWEPIVKPSTFPCQRFGEVGLGTCGYIVQTANYFVCAQHPGMITQPLLITVRLEFPGA